VYVSEADVNKSMGPCGSCSEFVSLSSEVCPLCEEPTGFDALTRLRARPRLLLAVVGVVAVIVSALAFVTGRILGARDAAETQQYVESNQEIDPEAIERARAAELGVQAELRQGIAAEEASLEKLGEAPKELESLRAELDSLPDEGRLREARKKRQAAFEAIMKAPR